jgi:hypothetical protein
MVGCLMLIGPLLVGQVLAPPGGDLKADVLRLVRQLDSPKLDQRDAAEAALLARGPAVLDLLPPPSDRTSAEVRERLGRIRQQLQRLAADAVTQASTITLHAQAMPVGDVLAAFQSQSGNTIVDDCPQLTRPSADANQKVDFDNRPFWPALDQFLDQAGLTLGPSTERRTLSVAVASGSPRIARFGHAGYSGPFRFEPLSVVRREPRPGSPSAVVALQAAWEPRLRVISLLQRMADVRAVDERGKPLPVVDREVQQEVPVGGQTISVKLDVPLRLPTPDVHQIASLKGRLLATIPGKIETFRFDKLAGAQKMEQRIAGVTVTLDEVRKTKQAWEVRIRVRYDDACDALASHRQWIFDNEAFLADADGKPIAYDSFETTLQEKNEVGVAYLFKVDRPIGEMSFVYKTPGTIVASDVEYELRDIRLP